MKISCRQKCKQNQNSTAILDTTYWRVLSLKEHYTFHFPPNQNKKIINSSD